MLAKLHSRWAHLSARSRIHPWLGNQFRLRSTVYIVMLDVWGVASTRQSNDRSRTSRRRVAALPRTHLLWQASNTGTELRTGSGCRVPPVALNMERKQKYASSLTKNLNERNRRGKGNVSYQKEISTSISKIRKIMPVLNIEIKE